MPSITVDPSLGLQISKQHRIEEEIPGLIKVYRDGHVERPQIIPNVSCSLPPEFGVTCTDVKIDKSTNIWARCYVPRCDYKVPLLVYFHGGGFCVGSASWSCYHEFLAKLARKANCVVLSVNYRLAPENPLPAAYDDGVKAVMWLRQHAGAAAKEYNYCWSNKCEFSSVFLGGDSAGGNIAHNVAIRLCQEFKPLNPLVIKGTILIQPFVGGESRTYSEIYTALPPHSALTLAASDTYWRLALPVGANRDHPWCNPIITTNMKEVMRVPASLVLISELDILKDRSLELCGALSRGGKKVELFMCKGVGHAFHILSKSQLAQTRTDELIAQIKTFFTAT
nr:probable carboxylesterase 6 [Ipomoea batatas]GME12456.1 probable carboxylesterase 6 [Ipomoea batatas]GME13399.1 probable carboxylesterase 6 [Ipomoea batatas]GME19930.1 probable carboxylesterase 6 [Ipomoea batatas]